MDTRCRFTRRTGVLVASIALLAALPGVAQDRRLTIDDIFDPVTRIDATGAVLNGVAWIDDTRFLWSRRTADDTFEWLVSDASGAPPRPLFDAVALESALRTTAGAGAEEARKLARPRTLVLDDGRRAAILTAADDLFWFELATGRLVRLTSNPEPERDPAFSPDGKLVAFTRAHDLHVVEVATGRERALTTGGSARLLNGRLDYVYQEEVYGRGHFRAFWWSPGSSRLAYLQLDLRLVPDFSIVDHLPYRQNIEVLAYPKAGDPNAVVRLGVVAAAGGKTTWMDTSRYSSREHLIVDVGWPPLGDGVVYQVQDREQTWLDLNMADTSTGASRTLFRETTKAWVDPTGPPAWLDDGTFLWRSERDGWLHVYHYRADGTLVGRVTTGEWEVRTLHGVDEQGRWIYFEATERSHIGLDVYRVRLDGTGLTRLSQTAGTHGANFNPGWSMYVGTWSDLTSPTETRLHRADGSEVRLLEANRIAALSTYRLSKPELVQVRTRDGFVMEALMIKPPDFDPSRRYPVYQHTYGGPHAPQVKNAWNGATYLYHQLIAQQGIVVWICDNRSASGKGAVSTWPVYKRFGEGELADIEDGLRWLKGQPWVDAGRIGLNGWSYGGFMVSYALTHSTSFAMGIAGGPVTDWRDYDSIYTERYMLMPQQNTDGYERSSPRHAARDLHGRLLLVHGTMDDNVHVQNTIQFAHALQKAGKPFELMLYPTERHALTDQALVKHMRQTMLDFILRTLKPDSPSPSM